MKADTGNHGLVFVVGIVRSGTSLLYSLLNRHPNIALMYECDVWDFPNFLTERRFRRNWLERQEFYNGTLTRHRLILGNSMRGLEGVREPDDLYQMIAERKNASLRGEKSPFYSLRLRQIGRRYPGCAIVLIWRDPAEICRSVLQAGRFSRYFGRPGMLSRVIYSQEQMIQQAAELERAGARIHHLSYSDLVEKTEATCRGICNFLGVPFDPGMLDLTKADFSAVYQDPHHEHLRSGVIKRRTRVADVNPALLSRIDRFQSRWNRIIAPWLGRPASTEKLPEPSAQEILYYKVSGWCLSCLDDGKRLLFEFVPLNWLQTYRRLKYWYLAANAPTSPEESSLAGSFKRHWFTVIMIFAILAVAGVLDKVTGPEITMAPFYLFPPALLALLVNRGWGKWAALLSAIMWSVLQLAEHPQVLDYAVLAWNISMRFVCVQTLVMVMDRVRREIATITNLAPSDKLPHARPTSKEQPAAVASSVG